MQAIPNVGEVIRKLPTMSRFELGELWEKSVGSDPSKKLCPELMRPVLAFRLQESAYGGHCPKTTQRLRATASSLEPESRSQTEALHRFKIGTRILREWGGKTHEVVLTSAGYEFEGSTYRSLSPIANKITGTRWSGPAFFGTKPKMVRK